VPNDRTYQAVPDSVARSDLENVKNVDTGGTGSGSTVSRHDGLKTIDGHAHPP
jgi:hypothetical protein